MRRHAVIIPVLLVAVLWLTSCGGGEPGETTEFDPRTDIRETRVPTPEPPEGPKIAAAFQEVMRDWRRRSTYEGLEFVEMSLRDRTIYAEWRSLEGDEWANGEVCDLMLSLKRGYKRRPIQKIVVKRHYPGGTQEIEIPGAVAEAYLNIQINDPEFFGRIGL